MNDEERKAWLDGLKEGSQVAEVAHHYRPGISTVERRTKTQIVLKDSKSRYRATDGLRVGEYTGWIRWRIMPVTEKILEETDRTKLAYRLQTLLDTTRELPISTVRKLLDILNEEEQGKEPQ